MTLQELDAISEMPLIGYENMGNGVMRPYALELKALSQPPDEPFMVTDERTGFRWTLGYADGQRWKRRSL